MVVIAALVVLLIIPPLIVNIPVAAPRAEEELIFKVPVFNVTPPVKVFPPESVNGEVELFWNTPVTKVLIGALIKTFPLPAPELVTVPILLILLYSKRIPSPSALLLFNIKFPVPFTPPSIFNNAPPKALIKVVPPELTVIG